MLTLGVPASPGVPAGLGELTLTLPYNDFERRDRSCRTAASTSPG